MVCSYESYVCVCVCVCESVLHTRLRLPIQMERLTQPFDSSKQLVEVVANMHRPAVAAARLPPRSQSLELYCLVVLLYHRLLLLLLLAVVVASQHLLPLARKGLHSHSHWLDLFHRSAGTLSLQPSTSHSPVHSSPSLSLSLSSVSLHSPFELTRGNKRRTVGELAEDIEAHTSCV